MALPVPIWLFSSKSARLDVPSVQFGWSLAYGSKETDKG